MSKKSKISQADLDLFQQAMAETRPIIKQHQRTERHAGIPFKKRPQEFTPFHFHEANDLDPVNAETSLSYKQPSISKKIFSKLRKGQYPNDAMLDLHGMTVDEAESALSSFLEEAIEHAMRVVLIIHGKGHHQNKPILKNKLNHWLRETNIVLAFCSATPSHGGQGAVYVLLKRHIEESQV